MIEPMAVYYLESIYFIKVRYGTHKAVDVQCYIHLSHTSWKRIIAGFASRVTWQHCFLIQRIIMVSSRTHMSVKWDDCEWRWADEFILCSLSVSIPVAINCMVT
jgi:hypothetical protein